MRVFSRPHCMKNLAMPKLDISPACLATIRELLASYAPESEVWAYGSRVLGEAHAGSDLDLVLRSPGDLAAPQKNVSVLTAALRESDLPILVDVLDWARLPENFRREIERAHVVVRRPGANQPRG
jgi:predicted nucleotidyltransferase